MCLSVCMDIRTWMRAKKLSWDADFIQLKSAKLLWVSNTPQGLFSKTHSKNIFQTLGHEKHISRKVHKSEEAMFFKYTAEQKYQCLKPHKKKKYYTIKTITCILPNLFQSTSPYHFQVLTIPLCLWLYVELSIVLHISSALNLSATLILTWFLFLLSFMMLFVY